MHPKPSSHSGRIVGNPDVIRFIRHATRWRRFFRYSLAASNFRSRPFQAEPTHLRALYVLSPCPLCLSFSLSMVASPQSLLPFRSGAIR